MTCTVAIDAMGGDRAPGEIVSGALAAVAAHGVRVLLVGRAEEITPHLPDGAAPEGVEVLDARELIAMDDEPAPAVRTRKDSSIVRAAQAVRDGAADAMVGAGNTGATMAAALLRMGRVKGVARPAIAVPIPVPDSHPQLLDRRRRDRRPRARVARPVRADGARVRPHPPRHRRAVGRPAVERRGRGQGRRDPQARVRAHAEGAGLRRQRRGPRLHARRHRGRHRHRRLHRQRRAQDDGGGTARRSPASCSRSSTRRPKPARRRRRSCRSCSTRPRPTTPTSRAARCCSGSRGCA